MRVTLRTVALSVMVVAETPADAIYFASQEASVADGEVNVAEARPLGGSEMARMTRDMSRELNVVVPGLRREHLNPEETLEDMRVWMVTVSVTYSLEWAQPVTTAASAEKGGGEGEGRVAGSIRPTDPVMALPVNELPLTAGNNPAPVSTDPNDREPQG